jgi:hypothetical protein
VVITVINAVLLLHTSMITTLPLWVAERTDAPLWIAAAAVVLNTVGVVALQVPASRRVRDVPSAARAGRMAAAFLALASLGLAAGGLAHGAVTIVLLLLAAVAHLGGELLQAAAAWELAFDLARTRHRASTRASSIPAMISAGSSRDPVHRRRASFSLIGWVSRRAVPWAPVWRSARPPGGRPAPGRRDERRRVRSRVSTSPAWRPASCPPADLASMRHLSDAVGSPRHPWGAW